MNKTDVIVKLSEKTGFAPEICRAVTDALETVSGSILLSRMKGNKLNDSAAVSEISEKSGISQADCQVILTAFEETFGEALSNKFRFFKHK